MKTIIAILMALASMTAFGQAVRLDTQVTTIATAPPQGSNAPLFGVPNAAITLCGYPANGVPCTNYAQSYTDNTEAVSCPQSAPVVLNGTNTCVQTADAGGNFGVWVTSGAYSYMITTTTGSTFGPYFFTAGTGGTLSGFLPLTGGTMTGEINLVTATPSGQNAISFNYAHATYCALIGCTLTGSLSGPDAVFTNSVEKQFVPNTTIQSAFTHAGSTGSVLIPANYGGTDGFVNVGSPPYNQVTDLRPWSESHPPNKLYAKSFGAVCDGGTDDTTAIQDAIDASVNYNFPLTTPQSSVVELPSGSCLITKPLVMGIHGSLVGQGDSTYLVGDYFAWGTTDSYAVIAIQTNGPLPGGASDEQRRIANMNIVGANANAYFNATGISVANLANVYSPTDYTFPDLLFDNLQISGFDTGMNLQDIRDSVIRSVNVDNNRVGINFNGQVLNVNIADSEIGFGAAPPTMQGGPAYGVIIQINNKYSSGCGTTVYCAPQAVDIHDTVIEGTDIQIYIGQCLGCNIHHNTIDECGAGRIGTGGECVLLGATAIGPLWIEDNWLGVETPDGFGIYSTANTTPSGSAAGFNFERNYFYGYQPTTGSIGIALNGTAGGSLQFGNITGNTFRQFAHGIYLNQSITQSTIRDNHGSLLTQSLIDLSGTASLVHGGTFIEGNTISDPVPVIIEGSATGFRTGYNQSPTQFVGGQIATGAGCTVSGGTIGSACSATINIPTAYADSSYTITSCMVTGASHNAIMGTVGSTAAGSFTVDEVALTTSSTTGGSIACNVNHQ